MHTSWPRPAAGPLVWGTCGLALFSSLLAAQTAEPARRAAIHPSVVRLAPGAAQSFKVVLGTARLKGAILPEKVIWSVNDVPGGNAQFGAIDSGGRYTAPATVPRPREIHICAEVEQAANRRLWATVLLGEPAYEMTKSWSEPADQGRLKKPHGISIDLDGSLLIADQAAHRIFRYTKAGQFVAEIGGGPGSEPGQFNAPRFATVDESGNIFVVDLKKEQPSLQVFDPRGRLLRSFAEKGSDSGQIRRGHGLGFDPRQRLFVTDVDNSRISIFDRAGQFLSAWGREGTHPGELNAPHGLFLDANGDVFVNGYYGPTQKFTPDGAFLLAFGQGDPPEGPVHFHSLTGDRWGNVFLTVRTLGPRARPGAAGPPQRISMAKYNNNGDFICYLRLSTRDHTETWAAVDRDGTVYALFTAKGSAGVEVFTEQ